MFPTLSSISLFERKNVASYTIGYRALGTSVFKNFQFFGFSCSRRTKNVPNTFLYLVVWKKKHGKLYNWIAGARNVRFKNFQFFGFSCSRRTKNVPNTFVYLVVWKKKRGKLYNWIAGARNVRFWKIFSFLDSAAWDAQKMFQHFRLSRCLKEKTWQAIQLDSGR